jgi:hypothetical protein
VTLDTAHKKKAAAGFLPACRLRFGQLDRATQIFAVYGPVLPLSDAGPLRHFPRQREGFPLSAV